MNFPYVLGSENSDSGVPWNLNYQTKWFLLYKHITHMDSSPAPKSASFLTRLVAITFWPRKLDFSFHKGANIFLAPAPQQLISQEQKDDNGTISQKLCEISIRSLDKGRPSTTRVRNLHLVKQEVLITIPDDCLDAKLWNKSWLWHTLKCQKRESSFFYPKHEFQTSNQ